MVFSHFRSTPTRASRLAWPLPQEPYLNLHQSYAPIVLGVTGVSGLAAVFYRRHRSYQAPPVRFTSQNITERFVSSLPELTGELNLELATVKQIEIFARSDQRTLWWGRLDLGTSIVQVSVPVTYRYHVPLRTPWKLEVSGDQVLVEAPALQAALPPAIHTDQLVTLSVRGWARGSTVKLRQQLERELTPSLNRFAHDPRRLQLVRETCRQSVAAFIQLWLEREGQWGAAGFRQITVQFADEAPPTLIKQPHVWS